MEALPDAIALSRLACRVRTFVGQDSNRVIRRILSDTLRIVSHDRTGASLCHRLAALPLIAATRLHLALLIPHLQFAARHLELTLRRLELTLRHLAFVICHLPFVICHLPFVICYLAFAICHLAFVIRRPASALICHLPFVICHLAFAICHPASALRHSCFPIPHSAFRRRLRSVRNIFPPSRTSCLSLSGRGAKDSADCRPARRVGKDNGQSTTSDHRPDDGDDTC